MAKLNAWHRDSPVSCDEDKDRFVAGYYSDNEFQRMQGFVVIAYSAPREDLMAIVMCDDIYEKDRLIDELGYKLLSDGAILSEKKERFGV
jgi:hypothetical protein